MEFSFNRYWDKHSSRASPTDSLSKYS